MSNGVGVIVAGDKTTRPGDDQHQPLLLPQPTATATITYTYTEALRPTPTSSMAATATATATGVLLMRLPDDERLPLLPLPQFVTKTCLTTYTYQQTVYDTSASRMRVQNSERVVANTATEERPPGATYRLEPEPFEQQQQQQFVNRTGITLSQVGGFLRQQRPVLVAITEDFDRY